MQVKRRRRISKPETSSSSEEEEERRNRNVIESDSEPEASQNIGKHKSVLESDAEGEASPGTSQNTGKRKQNKADMESESGDEPLLGTLQNVKNGKQHCTMESDSDDDDDSFRKSVKNGITDNNEFGVTIHKTNLKRKILESSDSESDKVKADSGNSSLGSDAFDKNEDYGARRRGPSARAKKMNSKTKIKEKFNKYTFEKKDKKLRKKAGAQEESDVSEHETEVDNNSTINPRDYFSKVVADCRVQSGVVNYVTYIGMTHSGDIAYFESGNSDEERNFHVLKGNHNDPQYNYNRYSDFKGRIHGFTDQHDSKDWKIFEGVQNLCRKYKGEEQVFL